ncbi:MAG: DUF3299 domain-containing protein [Verrucomicrobia bacterium]|nr:DUF3299 domain-containing protein [Verrucomicrobiota bacterium]
MRPRSHRFAITAVPRLALGLALVAAQLSGARAAVPLHNRLGCPDCGGGVNPHVPLLGGEGDFEPDPTLAALRRLGVDVKKSRPLPGSATAQTTPPTAPTTPAPPAATTTATPPVSPAPVTLPAPPVARPATVVSGYTVVSFGVLAGFTLPELGTKQPLAAGATAPDVLAHVPETVRRLDGKKVLVTGFMLPTKLADGFAIEFFLLSSPVACCYGTPPAAHEWISVKMRQEGLPPVQHVPMPLAGRLRLRPQWENGYLIALYEIEGDGLLKPKP